MITSFFLSSLCPTNVSRLQEVSVDILIELVCRILFSFFINCARIISLFYFQPIFSVTWVKQLSIYNIVFRTARPNGSIFCLKHLYGKRNLNCEIHSSFYPPPHPPLAPQAAPNMPPKNQKSPSLLPNTWVKNRIHNFDVNKACQ